MCVQRCSNTDLKYIGIINKNRKKLNSTSSNCAKSIAFAFLQSRSIFLSAPPADPAEFPRPALSAL